VRKRQRTGETGAEEEKEKKKKYEKASMMEMRKICKKKL
jgi:hypothetical protein